MFCSRALQFIGLKEFSVSTISIASVSLDSNILCMACMAVSHPVLRPVHNCKHPAVFFMSSFTTFITTFLAICRRTSPSQNGRNPGFLSRGISLQAKNTSSSVSTLVVSTGSFSAHIFLMKLANALLKSVLIVP